MSFLDPPWVGLCLGEGDYVKSESFGQLSKKRTEEMEFSSVLLGRQKLS
jgi:hypothetical protein